MLMAPKRAAFPLAAAPLLVAAGSAAPPDATPAAPDRKPAPEVYRQPQGPLDKRIDPEKVNVMGGATAIGHPLGASGIRLIGTLARILDAKGGRYGVATMCCGGGQGFSVKRH